MKAKAGRLTHSAYSRVIPKGKAANMRAFGRKKRSQQAWGEGQENKKWHQVLVRRWSNQNPHTLLVEMDMDTPTAENCLAVSTREISAHSTQPRDAFLGIYAKEMLVYNHTKRHVPQHSIRGYS